MPAVVDLGAPAGLDHRGARRLDDDRRTVDAVAGHQLGALEDRRIVVRAGGEHRGLRDRPGGALRARSNQRVGDVGHRADRLDRDVLDDVRLLRHGEAVALPVRALEAGDDAVAVGEVDDQRAVGALVAQVQLAQQPDLLPRHPLAPDLAQRLGRERVELGLEPGDEGVVEPRFDRALAHHPHVREPDAVRRQHPGVGVDEDPLHAERVGHPARVLAAGAAEAAQRVRGHVVAAVDRDLLDRARHVLDRDGEEAVGRVLRAKILAGGPIDLGGERGELSAHHLGVEHLVLAGAEDPGEQRGDQLADHEVGVGHGERPALAVGRRARVGAGRARPHPHARAVEEQDRAAARGDGVDAHHRRAHADAADLGHERALVLAVVVRHVGRGAAHVEGDDAVDSGHRARLDRADDPAGGPREDRVLALERVRLDEPAVRLHEHQPALAEVGGDAVDVAAQDRRQVGVDHGGVAAAHQLHQRAHPVRHRDLRKSDLGGDLGGPRLVVVIAVAVHEDDRRRADAVCIGGLEPAAQRVRVERLEHLAVGAHAFVRLDHALVDRLGQHDAAGEDVGPVLVADAERVGEAAGDHQHGALALALEQRVGRHRGAHLDHLDRVAGQGRVGVEPEHVADALERGVVVMPGVLREELVGDELARGPARDDVGKRPAAVDPELPAGGGGCGH